MMIQRRHCSLAHGQDGGAHDEVRIDEIGVREGIDRGRCGVDMGRCGVDMGR